MPLNYETHLNLKHFQINCDSRPGQKQIGLAQIKCVFIASSYTESDSRKKVLPKVLNM